MGTGDGEKVVHVNFVTKRKVEPVDIHRAERDPLDQQFRADEILKALGTALRKGKWFKNPEPEDSVREELAAKTPEQLGQILVASHTARLLDDPLKYFTAAKLYKEKSAAIPPNDQSSALLDPVRNRARAPVASEARWEQ